MTPTSAVLSIASLLLLSLTACAPSEIPNPEGEGEPGLANAQGGLVQVGSVQGEAMALASSLGRTFADATADRGAALLIWSNGTATGRVTLSSRADRLTLRAKADLCRGAPRAQIKVNGTDVLTADVTSTTWSDLVAPVTLPAGDHQVTVAFINDHYESQSCDRNLRIDRVELHATQAEVYAGFETGITEPTGFSETQAWAPDRLRQVTFPVRRGQGALRIEVRPGDDVGGWGGERAELVNIPSSAVREERSLGGVFYYGVSVYLPSGFQPVGTAPYTWNLIMQLHPPAGGPRTTFGINLSDRFGFSWDTGDINGAMSVGRERLDRIDPNGGAFVYDQWVDFIIAVKIATNTNDGYFKIWRRSVGTEATFRKVMDVTNVPTLQYSSADPSFLYGSRGFPYHWKAGLYRSPTPFTQVLYMDSWTRGGSFAEVELQAFGTANGTATP
jgi:hypothetical protein